jgi:hypothetical protein
VTTRIKLELAGAVLAIILVAVCIGAWVGAREDRIRAESTVEAQKSVIAAAAGREADRDAALKTSLSVLEAAKNAVQTPSQAISRLPSVIPLPQPIYLSVPAAVSQGGGNGAPVGIPQTDPAKAAAAGKPLPDAIIPSADLKPLYDFGVECQACKIKLTNALADRADDAVKLTAVTKERDGWETSAKGGTTLQRIKRAGKWFLIGAAAGAVAGAVAQHH